jgi:hypothetical protein
LAAAILLIAQAILVAFLWHHGPALGVHGDVRVIFLPITAAAEFTLAAVFWPRRR